MVQTLFAQGADGIDKQPAVMQQKKQNCTYEVKPGSERFHALLKFCIACGIFPMIVK